jgi:hypothetical protein
VSIARSTINRGIAELKAGSNELAERVRRPGGGLACCRRSKG